MEGFYIYSRLIISATPITMIFCFFLADGLKKLCLRLCWEGEAFAFDVVGYLVSRIEGWREDIDLSEWHSIASCALTSFLCGLS